MYSTLDLSIVCVCVNITSGVVRLCVNSVFGCASDCLLHWDTNTCTLIGQWSCDASDVMLLVQHCFKTEKSFKLHNNIILEN